MKACDLCADRGRITPASRKVSISTTELMTAGLRLSNGGVEEDIDACRAHVEELEGLYQIWKRGGVREGDTLRLETFDEFSFTVTKVMYGVKNKTHVIHLEPESHEEKKSHDGLLPHAHGE